MVSAHIPAATPVGPTTTPNHGTSANMSKNMTLLMPRPAEEHVSTSFYVVSQILLVELLPWTPISILATFWKNILNASVLEGLLGATFKITETHMVLQEPVSVAVSENTEDLGTM